MTQNSPLWKGSLFLALLVLGCAAPLSQQARSQITFTGSFADLTSGKMNLVGETLMLGGKIIDVKSSEGASELTALQLPLNASQHPVDEDRSEGRYLIRSERFLDPEVFKKDTLFATVGKVVGFETRNIEEFSYTYPVLQEVEIKLLPKPYLYGPVFHIGIGFGTTF